MKMQALRGPCEVLLIGMIKLSAHYELRKTIMITLFVEGHIFASNLEVSVLVDLRSILAQLSVVCLGSLARVSPPSPLQK